MNYKKSAISGEYMIGVLEDGSIVAYRVYDNVKGALREVANAKGFQYDTNWTTRQFGSKICKEFGNGKSATVGEYVIRVLGSGSIEAYRVYENVKAALREISGKVGFTVDPEWTTRQLGNKLIDFINK